MKRMRNKHIVNCVWAFAIGALSSAHAGTLLSEGETLEMSFSSLPFVEYVGYQDQGGLSFELSPTDQLDAGESFQLELFNDQGYSVPVSLGAMGYSVTFSSPTDSFGLTSLNAFGPAGEGSFRLTALSGSINIESIYAQAIVDGNRYGEYLISTPVPEPGTATLFIVGLALIHGVGQRAKVFSSPARIGRNNRGRSQ